ncbi:MAG: hypothetical protein U0527_09065 [Candidatus Eisenbacteria bacterium]
MSRLRSLCVCVALLTGSATFANSTVTPISHSRRVATFAFLDYAVGQEPLRSDESIQSEESGAFDEHAVCHVEHGNSYVTALANQSSSIEASGITATMSISAEGAVVLPERGTLGLASTDVIYEFSVDAPTTCQLSAQIVASGGGVVDIDLSPIGGGFLINRQFFETDESYEQSLLLQPGSYRVTAGGGGDGATGPNGSGTSAFDLTFSLSFPTASVPVADESSFRVTPNPSRGPVSLSFDRAAAAWDAIEVLDPAGRHVRKLTPTGGASISWDLRSDDGARVAPGVYFFRAGGEASGRLVVLR